MDYVTRKILEQVFGKDPLKFGSSVVGARAGANSKKVFYRLKIPHLKPAQLASAFWRLRQKELIEYQEDNNGGIRIILTESGKKKMLSYKFDDLAINQPKSWDSHWWAVAFDIPETKRKARHALVQKMKNLGLIQFQKSLWLYPYECRDEIDFVAEVFEVGKYV